MPRAEIEAVDESWWSGAFRDLCLRLAIQLSFMAHTEGPNPVLLHVLGVWGKKHETEYKANWNEY
jgi:hypothetical protein